MTAASARRVSRDSERRRRMLGLAETPEHQRQRYAADPEPQRAACRARYQANRDQILDDRAGYYAANRSAILAAKAAHYAANREQILARRGEARRQSAAQHDQAAATDALSVVASAVCAQCGTRFTFSLGDGQHMVCRRRFRRNVPGGQQRECRRPPAPR